MKYDDDSQTFHDLPYPDITIRIEYTMLPDVRSVVLRYNGIVRVVFEVGNKDIRIPRSTIQQYAWNYFKTIKNPEETYSVILTILAELSGQIEHYHERKSLNGLVFFLRHPSSARLETFELWGGVTCLPTRWRSGIM